MFLQNIFTNTKSIYEAMNVQECKETIRLRLCFIMIILVVVLKCCFVKVSFRMNEVCHIIN